MRHGRLAPERGQVDVQISGDRSVRVGPGTKSDPGVWLLMQFPLLRWLTPADARAIATALNDAADEADRTKYHERHERSR